MCLICVDLVKGTLSAREGRRALGEMRGKIGSEHAKEVEAKLKEAETAETSAAKKP